MHKPDRSRIAKALQSLDWQPLPQGDDVLWEDGSRLMVAVPICGDANKPNGSWHYEISIVTIKCGEDYFDLESNGEPCDWSMGDIDWFVALDGGPVKSDLDAAVDAMA